CQRATRAGGDAPGAAGEYEEGWQRKDPLMQRLMLILLIVTVAVVAYPAAASAQGLFVAWSDHPDNPEFAGDAVFQRELSCWNAGRREECQLTVAAIHRKFCPAHVSADSGRTDTGDLTVTRRGTMVDLEFEGFSFAGPTHWSLHLTLRATGKDLFIVDQASGVVVTRPLVPEDRVRSTALIPIVKASQYAEGIREWATVDLSTCPRVAVVAAKK